LNSHAQDISWSSWPSNTTTTQNQVMAFGTQIILDLCELAFGEVPFGIRTFLTSTNLVLHAFANRGCVAFSSTVKAFYKRTTRFVVETETFRKIFHEFLEGLPTNYFRRSLLIPQKNVQVVSFPYEFCKCVMQILNFNFQNFASEICSCI
jgi:hypothetical protein